MRGLLTFVQIAVALVACLAAQPSHASSNNWWQGTWDTDYGEVKLQRIQKHVYGDYGTWGTIEGVLSKNDRILRGVYRRNDDGSFGFIEWRLNSSTDFSGRWNRPGQVFPDWETSGIVWNGRRKDGRKPTLSVYRGNGNIGTFMAAQQLAYTHWARMSYLDDPTKNKASAPPDTAGLDYGRKLTPAKLRTAFEMQRHVRAISKKGRTFRSDGEAEAKAALEALGYKLLGNGIINETGGGVSLTRAAAAQKNDAIVVSFRGTKGDTLAETVTAGILVDGRIGLTAPSFIPSARRDGALVHKGFHSSYLKLRDQIHDALSDQTGKYLFITGHSLGGALAQLMAWDVSVNFSDKFASVTIITSGSPRVGNSAFAQSFSRDVPDSLRILVHKDPVPAVPWLDGTYVHAGKSLVIGRDDGVLMQHKDQNFRPAMAQFAFYHGNDKYYSAIQALSRRASSNSRLNPDGDAWAREATLSWYNRSREKRGKAKKAVDRVKKIFN